MIISNKAAEIIGKHLSNAFWEAVKFGEEVQVTRCMYMIHGELIKDNQCAAARILRESFINSDEPNKKRRKSEKQ